MNTHLRQLMPVHNISANRALESTRCHYLRGLSPHDAADLLGNDESCVLTAMHWTSEHVHHLRKALPADYVASVDVNAIARKLVDMGLVEWGQLFSDEGLMCGSGYWPTPRGEIVRDLLIEKTDQSRNSDRKTQ